MVDKRPKPAQSEIGSIFPEQFPLSPSPPSLSCGVLQLELVEELHGAGNLCIRLSMNMLIGIREHECEEEYECGNWHV